MPGCSRGVWARSEEPSSNSAVLARAAVGAAHPGCTTRIEMVRKYLIGSMCCSFLLLSCGSVWLWRTRQGYAAPVLYERRVSASARSSSAPQQRLQIWIDQKGSVMRIQADDEDWYSLWTRDAQYIIRGGHAQRSLMQPFIISADWPYWRAQGQGWQTAIAFWRKRAVSTATASALQGLPVRCFVAEGPFYPSVRERICLSTTSQRILEESSIGGRGAQEVETVTDMHMVPPGTLASNFFFLPDQQDSLWGQLISRMRG